MYLGIPHLRHYCGIFLTLKMLVFVREDELGKHLFLICAGMPLNFYFALEKGEELNKTLVNYRLFPDKRLELLAGTTYSVGSKSADFPLLKDGNVDKSISRSHATVTVYFEKSNSQLSLQV